MVFKGRKQSRRAELEACGARQGLALSFFSGRTALNMTEQNGLVFLVLLTPANNAAAILLEPNHLRVRHLTPVRPLELFLSYRISGAWQSTGHFLGTQHILYLIIGRKGGRKEEEKREEEKKEKKISLSYLVRWLVSYRHI